MGSLSLSSLFVPLFFSTIKSLPSPPVSFLHPSQPPTMAKLSRAQQLSALKSDNENLKCLNSRLIKDLADLKQEIASLLESEKSLEGELSRSHGQRAAHLAELEATRLASRINSKILDAMKLEKEELQRSVAEARKSSFWTLAFSGAAIFGVAGSLAYLWSRRDT